MPPLKLAEGAHYANPGTEEFDSLYADAYEGFYVVIATSAEPDSSSARIFAPLGMDEKVAVQAFETEVAKSETITHIEYIPEPLEEGFNYRHTRQATAPRIIGLLRLFMGR